MVYERTSIFHANCHAYIKYLINNSYFLEIETYLGEIIWKIQKIQLLKFLNFPILHKSTQKSLRQPHSLFLTCTFWWQQNLFQLKKCSGHPARRGRERRGCTGLSAEGKKFSQDVKGSCKPQLQPEAGSPCTEQGWCGCCLEGRVHSDTSRRSSEHYAGFQRHPWLDVWSMGKVSLQEKATGPLDTQSIAGIRWEQYDTVGTVSSHRKRLANSLLWRQSFIMLPRLISN